MWFVFSMLLALLLNSAFIYSSVYAAKGVDSQFGGLKDSGTKECDGDLKAFSKITHILYAPW